MTSPVTHSYSLPFTFGYKKVGYFLLFIGLFLIIIAKDNSYLLLNISLFIVNFSNEKIENRRIFNVRYQSLKVTVLTIIIMLISLSILSRFNPDINRYDIEPFKILLLINILYFLFFQFYKLKIKE